MDRARTSHGTRLYQVEAIKESAVTKSGRKTALLDDPAVLAERIRAVDAPHVAKLNALAGRIAAEHGSAPFFDPLSGGQDARLLLLLETPGTQAGPARFVSQDNATGTGRNLRRFLSEADIGRDDLVIWNAVPFVIHAEGARNRAPTKAEAEAGRQWLEPLLHLLPALRAVVLSGRFARGCRGEIETLRPDLAIFEMPHPSPVFVVTDPAIAPGIVEVLRRAGEASRR